MVRVDALGADGEYRTRHHEVLRSMSGAAVAELSVAPALYVSRTLRAQRNIPALPVAHRKAALAKAADLFAAGVVAGLEYDDYIRLASRLSGLPITVIRSGADSVTRGVVSAFDALRPARPAGAVMDWRDEAIRTGSALWVRRGEVLGVLAAGNGPGIHASWPQALALGYRVAVRPSRREPLTAHRLIHALRQAGFRAGDATYLPTDHGGADEIIRSADLATVYGGQDIADKYSGDATVFVNGPGRTKILVTADQDWREHLDTIVDSIAGLGGAACVNATAVLCEGDPAALASAIAQRLSAIEPLPSDDERAILPTQTLDNARKLASYLAANAAGTTPLLGADQVVATLDDGSAALRPAVHLMDRPATATLNVELPFPCVWVAPWSRTDGVGPLRRSLVVKAITADEDLLDELIAEPTIANVYCGHRPSYFAAPDLPHDGFLADFLMRNKGFVRD
ncbi:aldehyde dehydrogenase family protein [Mycobacterium sp.]|uniref:aldehyde dehydrogenase family protein n=1 Tax=Mycobacterium sp. TaxID=1785 RepID=UPI0025ED88E6|nr:aldehyde dehydrogenase family protein [Mycobacterium sp.]